MAKRTLYVSESASTLTVKRGDVDKLKKASISLFLPSIRRSESSQPKIMTLLGLVGRP